MLQAGNRVGFTVVWHRAALGCALHLIKDRGEYHVLSQGIAALILVAPAIVAPMFGRSGSSSPRKDDAPSDIELDKATTSTSR